MPSIKSLALAALWFAATAVAQSTPEPSTENSPQTNIDLQEILNALPAESLHAALHEHLDDKFKDGIYEKDSHAVKAVQNVNPDLAIKLVAAARYDLLRRATNTTTTSAAPPPATTSTTGTAGQLTTSAAPTLSNGVILVTTTNAQGSTYVATVTPGGGVVSSILLLTTTLPDGSRSTSTSFLLVPASKSTAASGTAGPKLQGAASQLRGESLLLHVIVGVMFVLGAGMIWL